MLEEILGNPVLVAPTTSLAHAAALPHLIDERDAVVLDQQVHTSVSLATHHLPRELERADNSLALVRAEFGLEAPGEPGRIPGGPTTSMSDDDPMEVIGQLMRTSGHVQGRSGA